MEFFEIAFDELRHGVLAKEFLAGAAAAVIVASAKVQEAWRLLMHDPNERLPWNATLLDIARNRQAGQGISDTLGDAYYFKPGRHAYFARKLELSRPGEGAPISCNPPRFKQGEDDFIPDAATVELCWQIGAGILRAMTPAGQKEPDFRVAVQRLKYQEDNEDLDRIYGLIKSSLGGWGQLGYTLDAQRDTAGGFLAPRGICDAYALLSMLPLFGNLARRVNALGVRLDQDSEPGPGAKVIGKAHYDSRYFSGLCGERDCVQTEVKTNGRWVELPVGLGTIVVLPGTLADRFGLRPMLHRVLYVDKGRESAESTRAANVTVLFGAK